MVKISDMRFSYTIKRLGVIASIILFTLNAYAKGYNITVQIDNCPDSVLILAHYLNKSIYPDDTAQVDKKGKVVFRGNNTLHQGMYIIYLPSGEYFEIMMGSDQEFKILTDTTNYVENAVIEGSVDNELFFDFQKYMYGRRNEQKRLNDALKNAETEKQKEKARNDIKKLMIEREQKIDGIITSNPDLFVSTFLKATVDIKVPDPPKNEDGSIDSTWQYKYFKAHYFDNFDPHNGNLLYTPLYENKVMHYLNKVVAQIPDSLIKEIDWLIEGARSDSALFRYLMVSLFNKYGDSEIMGMDAVQVHLAKEYYLTDAWWVEDKFLEELRERVEILDPLLIGKKAPNVELLMVPKEHFPAAKNDSALKRYPHVGQLIKLHDINAEYLVLLFWEANCSHCKKAVPKLYELYKEKLESQNITVVSVSTLFGEDGKEKWIDFVNKHETYDWLHAWNPYAYEFKVKFDIRSTPQIFVLDKDKTIIGKRIGAEQVPELIEAYKKQQEYLNN